jgi:hypothetical protein
MILRALVFLLGVLAGGVAEAAPPPTGVKVEAPENNGGLNLVVSWELSRGATGYSVLRRDGGLSEEGNPWTVVADQLPADKVEVSDQVTSDPWETPPLEAYTYRVVALDAARPAPPVLEDDEAKTTASREAYALALAAIEGASPPVSGSPEASFLVTTPGHVLLLALIVTVGGLMFYFSDQARKGHPMFIRRIPGIDAIEEGIGRATEMGRPVLYVPGIDELQDIQTIASMLILGQVAKKVAEYQADIIVSCTIPIVREVADEVVKAGFYQAGYPEAYKPANTRFISSEQFAFCAGTNGIILREKPSTNIFLGRFFAEALILAETGFVNRSIQIAGTAEATQLPFFVAACDYTLIGEELFAVSAYLSQDPRLVSSLKASDYVKLFIVAMMIVGTIAATFGNDSVITLFTIAD